MKMPIPPCPPNIWSDQSFGEGRGEDSKYWSTLVAYAVKETYISLRRSNSRLALVALTNATQTEPKTQAADN